MKQSPSLTPPAMAAALSPVTPSAATTGRVRVPARPRASQPPPPDAGPAELCRQWRAPQHERGRRRVDAILDAASALLTEGGLAALSVDAVAKRSQTSKSSMYHFFPDRDSIVRALAERHFAAITGRADFWAVDAAVWARLTTEEVVDRYLAPFSRYVAEHPDVLPCMRAAARVQGDTAAEGVLDAMGLARAEAVIAARFPAAKPAERRTWAAMLFAVTIGTKEVLSRLSGAPPHRAAQREMRRVLLGYLTLLERGDGTA